MFRKSAVIATMLAALAAAPAPARAGTPELSLAIARLLESLDAGLSRADLRALRIEIGAELRLQAATGLNANAALGAYAKALSATDHAWTVLSAAPVCAMEKAAMRDAAACRALLTPLYKDMGIALPAATAPVEPAAWIEQMLKSLQARSEAALRALG